MSKHWSIGAQGHRIRIMSKVTSFTTSTAGTHSEDGSWDRLGGTAMR